MKRIIILFPTLLALLIMISGCVSIHVPSVSDGFSTKKLVINLKSNSLDFTGALPITTRKNGISDFITTLGHYTKLNLDSPDNEGFNVMGIRVTSREKVAFGGPLIMSIISTPVVPLMFTRNQCKADIIVNYALADKEGNIIYENELRELIRGHFSGWSFIRLATRQQAMNELRQSIPELAAKMLIKDLRSFLTSYGTTGEKVRKEIKTGEAS